MIFAPGTFYYAIAGRMVEVTAAFTDIMEFYAHVITHLDEGCLADLGSVILMAKLVDIPGFCN